MSYARGAGAPSPVFAGDVLRADVMYAITEIMSSALVLTVVTDEITL